MKKIIIALLFSFSFSVFSQSISPKWIKVWDYPEQQAYVDTTTIKQYDNQISALSISFYKEPQLISSINKSASCIKSRVLFNLATQRYSVIGSLFYDAKQRILAESSLPGSSSSGSAFSISIDSNQVMVAVYAYCVNFLNLREKNITEKEFSINGDKTRAVLDKIEKESLKNEIEQKPILPVETIRPAGKGDNKGIKVKSKKEPEIKVEKIPEQEKNVVEGNQPIMQTGAKDTSVKIIDNKSSGGNELKSLVNKKNESEKPVNENNPKSTIFSDGNKFSFQISSWKNKSKAESEVARLKKEGHNAFIVEAFIPERKSTWYRVRIGYFDSIEETEAYMKKLK